MRYRITGKRSICFPSGRVEGKGFVFESAGEYTIAEKILEEMVKREWLEPIDEPTKVTKEVTDAPVKKGRFTKKAGK